MCMRTLRLMTIIKNLEAADEEEWHNHATTNERSIEKDGGQSSLPIIAAEPAMRALVKAVP